ncbi:hypothetical protein C8Q80DRAFT_429889 [Daedaleopsis nitida]|nr:hypothetical protein C8Q80DRAFT_429889 [Daedaleopsis nitida]
MCTDHTSDNETRPYHTPMSAILGLKVAIIGTPPRASRPHTGPPDTAYTCCIPNAGEYCCSEERERTIPCKLVSRRPSVTQRRASVHDTGLAIILTVCALNDHRCDRDYQPRTRQFPSSRHRYSLRAPFEYLKELIQHVQESHVHEVTVAPSPIGGCPRKNGLRVVSFALTMTSRTFAADTRRVCSILFSLRFVRMMTGEPAIAR